MSVKSLSYTFEKGLHLFKGTNGVGKSSILQALLVGLYGFVARPETLNPMFLGILDLSQRSIVLALLAGLFMFIQAKMIMPKKTAGQKQGLKVGGMDFSSMMGQQMTYFMPIITIVFGLSFPAALPLYWMVITLFGIIQQRLTPSIIKTQLKD